MDLRTHTDQLGRTVRIPTFPQRIVSVVPSQTELLFHLGLDHRVVGITKFCVHPESWFRSKTRVGGTKNLHMDVIRDLQPDLIIANREENNRADIEVLEKEFPVWVSDVNNLGSALQMIRSVAEITESHASKLILEIENEFSELVPIYPKRKVLYLIWKQPYMAARNDTFIHDMLNRCGLVNVIAQSRYPELTEASIMDLDPELVLLSSEPFPFKQRHVEELHSLLPNAEIRFVDGELFSWYGSRLKHAPAYFSHLIGSMKK